MRKAESVPHYSWYTMFMADFNRLSQAQQDAFIEAVKLYIVGPFLAGQQPPSQVFHKMSGQPYYEFRWDSSGRFRATCELFINALSEVEIKWRHIGSHDIYKNP